jgi:hypothetical protein
MLLDATGTHTLVVDPGDDDTGAGTLDLDSP